MASAEPLHDCSGHGVMTDGSCRCLMLWGGGDCAVPFSAAIGQVPWSAFVYFGGLANLALALFMLSCLFYKYFPILGATCASFSRRCARRCRRRCCTCTGNGHFDPAEACCWVCFTDGRGWVPQRQPKGTFNHRDLNMAVCMIACVLRLMFFASVDGTVLPNTVSVTTMFNQPPQVMWICCFAHQISVWAPIVRHTATQTALPAWMNRCLFAGGAITVLVTAANMSLHAMVEFVEMSVLIPSAVMGAYCFGMVVLLACYHDYIRSFLGVLRRGKNLVHSQQRRVFVRAAGIVGLACIGGGVLTAVILSLTIAAAAEHFDSFRSPTLFYALLWALHGGLEVGAATTLLFCNLQPTHMWWRGVYDTHPLLPSPQEVTAMCTSQNSEPLLRAKSIPVLKLVNPEPVELEAGGDSCQQLKRGTGDTDRRYESTESGGTLNAARMRSASSDGQASADTAPTEPRATNCNVHVRVAGVA